MTTSIYAEIPGFDRNKYLADKMGAVLMDVDPDCISYTDNAVENQYVSAKPDQWYAKGLTGRKHLTVMYGILPTVPAADVEALLEYGQRSYDGINAFFDEGDMPMVKFKGWANFGRDDYDCWVAKVETDDSVDHIRGVLGFVPHLNTFADYSPHITVGYFKKGLVTPDDFNMDTMIEGIQFRLGGCYGDEV